VSWAVEIGDEFELEFDGLHEDVQTETWHYRDFCKRSARNWGGPELTRSRALVTQT
jgi:hypothetical protein